MRRLITYLNSLLLGMILGMIFVAILDASPTVRQDKVRGDASALLRLVVHHRDIVSLNKN